MKITKYQTSNNATKTPSVECSFSTLTHLYFIYIVIFLITL